MNTNARAPIILLDDEPDVLESESTVLRSEGFMNLAAFQDATGVLETIQSRDAEVVLLDLTLPLKSGEAILEELRRLHPHVPVIVITGTADVDIAVRCMKAGAFDYMVKPVERSRFVSGVRRAIEMRDLKREVAGLRSHLLNETLENPQAFSGMKTRSRSMLSIFQFMEAIAGTREPVLIVGETGVGKELVARALHALSGRGGELVTVNAASLDDTMLSDALFGHRKGAYTGATEARAGLLAAAGGGSIFLDEIGDTSPATQLKLLRLVETGEYLPLGSDVLRRADARFLFATNHGLDHLRNPAVFRSDLYYRLSTHLIVIPPLRARPEDIPVLFEHFLAEACAAFNKAPPAMPERLPARLLRYGFPGNVRELRSIVFDAVSRTAGPACAIETLLAGIERTLAAESEHSDGAAAPRHDGMPTLHQATERLIQDALARANGSVTAAASLLGISRQALSKRLRRGGQRAERRMNDAG